jgi:AraC family transcriptional regulator
VKPRIEILKEKKLVGRRRIMSFSSNNTKELWQGFMPRRKEIVNTLGSELYSIQIYSSNFFNNFDDDAEFGKWAAIEVSNFDCVPKEMESFVLSGGLYAVFLYKGDPREASPFFKYIIGDWQPNSNYILDDRPHFEILGEKYKNESPKKGLDSFKKENLRIYTWL